MQRYVCMFYLTTCFENIQASKYIHVQYFFILLQSTLSFGEQQSNAKKRGFQYDRIGLKFYEVTFTREHG